VGFERHTQEGLYRGSFINRPVLYSPHVHIAQQFISLAQALESGDVPASKRALGGAELVPKMFKADSSDLDACRDRLVKSYPPVDGKRLVLLYPGCGDLPIRAWPSENFIELAKRICGSGYAAGIIGMERDHDLAASIVAGCGSPACVDMTGYTKRMLDLLLLFKHASLLITNDGGPGHFAAMTSLPAIILYGPETPVLYGSLSPKAECLYEPFSCSPCLTAYNFRTSPCNGNNMCLKHLTVDRVWGRALALLG
jgi:ADP-heptose:LPS heptosyltransferase